MADRASEMRVSKAAVDELRSLAPSDAAVVISFLEHLGENPYDQTLIGAADAKGDLFASSVTDKLYVYWSFDAKNHATGLTMQQMQPTINVLGLARKSANNGFVPLLSPVDKKLKYA